MKYLNLKQMTIAAMLGASLLLTGCGGGGTSAVPIGPGSGTPPPSDPTIGTYLENINLTEGSKDANTGRSYLQARQPGFVDDEYLAANVTGLTTAHSEGWTGLGVNIGIVDGSFSSTTEHGFKVSYTAETVAPAADFSQDSYVNILSSVLAGNQFSTSLVNQDVINHSWGYGVSQSIGGNTGEEIMTFMLNNFEDANPGSLQVLAGPNKGPAGHEGSSTDDSGLIDGMGAAHLSGNLNGDYIFVGAEDSDYTSVPAGSLSDLWIVADGTDVWTGTGQGTSFAAPKVAGAAALIFQKFPEVTAGGTVSILLNTADDSFNGYSEFQHGQGMLDVGAALAPVGNLH